MWPGWCWWGEGLPARAGPAQLAEAGDVREAEVAVFGYPGEPPGTLTRSQLPTWWKPGRTCWRPADLTL